jgi:TonB-dependent siderophore receptor
MKRSMGAFAVVLLAWGGAIRAKEKPLPTSLVEYVEVQDESLPQSNTIASKLPLPVDKTPANVGTVGRALIDEQGAWSLGDALPNVSGLNVQSGSGTFDYFAIRGFDSVSSGLVMLDGAVEPEASYYSLYNVRGIEVIKGPAGFLYGKNPLAGAINVVRKQPEAESSLGAHAMAGTFGTHEAGVDWNLGGPGRTPSFRINGVWRESDGFRDQTDSRHVAVNPALTVHTSDRTKLTFNAEHVDADYSPDSGLPVVYAFDPTFTFLLPSQLADVPRTRSYQAPTDFSDQTVGRFQIDHETRLSDRVTLRSKAYFRDLDWASSGTILRGAFPFGGPSPQVIRDTTVLDDRQQFAGAQFEAIFTFGTAVQHHLLAGLEVEHESDEYQFGLRQLDDVDLDLNPIPTAFDQGVAFPLDSPGDVTNMVVSPYVVDQIKLSSKVDVLAGLRYDHIDNDGTVTSLFNPTPISYSRDDSELSPMLGVVVAPAEHFSFYASASRSHAPPSTRLVDEFDPASREPEQATQFEIGARKRFLDGRLRTTLALYHIDRENIAITDTNFFTQQSGDQRSQGVELELAAEPWPRLHAFLAYAYNDSELTDYTPCVPDGSPGGCTIQNFTGNTPILAPRNLVRAWVSKTFESGLGFGAGGRFTGKQFYSENNLLEIDSALTFDATVFYDLPSKVRLKLDLRNLADAEYEYRGIAGADSAVPADERSLVFGVECRM